jgi:hypothetical protein
VGLLLLFLDGVGLGMDDPDANPFAAAATPVLDELAGGAWISPCPHARTGRTFAALDATLGDPGLPQSATGQAALLSGRDAVAAMGGPYGPWPGPTLKRFLADGELFAWTAERFGVEALGWGTAYPPPFFAALQSGRIRLNVPAWAARRAGVALPDLAAYRRGEAIAADLDGAAFAERGVEPPGGHRPGPAGAAAAGRRLAAAAVDRAVTFVDVWTTDRAGHRAELAESRALVERLDAFLGGVLEARAAATTLLVVSDHGNLEDARHGRHTRAPVPLVAVGREAEAFAGARSLLDVAPAARRTSTGS